MTTIQPTGAKMSVQMPPPGAVTVQPVAYSEGRKVPFEAWAAAPPQMQGYQSVLPGLELLSFLNAVSIDQIVDPIEVAVNVSTRKNYIIATPQNHICYRVSEETTASMLICCGPQREFTMHISDYTGAVVLSAHRVFKHCMGCLCCDCCAGNAQTIEVMSRGVPLGSVVEMMFCTRNQFEIRDANNQPVAVMVGPACMPCNCDRNCCKDIDFHIYAPDMSTELASITRRYLGCWTHYLTTADSFAVNFSPNIDVKLKALIIGTVFLMDFRWFEVRQRNNNNNGGGLLGLAVAASIASNN